ncbi:uncharacterized protein LOC105693774 [Athalia rosae]|uniref:uncharacterized protein LOC105693774 n=1 Tax=Athalia rosae TaxID=37344 RepID=UPI000626BB65|nr:uncharacterized protein LOC105693774 [Athalia rosae]
MHAAALCFLFACGILSDKIISPTSAGIAEILNEVEEVQTPAHPIVQANSFRDVLEDNNVGTPCYVEYQVTKRTAGRCIKLARNIRACAAGSYLDPFHPECM